MHGFPILLATQSPLSQDHPQWLLAGLQGPLVAVLPDVGELRHAHLHAAGHGRLFGGQPRRQEDHHQHVREQSG